MDPDQILALLAAAVLAFVVRFLNIAVAWLARVLAVEAPEPIPTASTVARTPPNTPQPPVASEQGVSGADPP